MYFLINEIFFFEEDDLVKEIVLSG